MRYQFKLEAEPSDLVAEADVADEMEYWEYRINEAIGRVLDEFYDAKDYSRQSTLEYQPIDLLNMEFEREF